jgi:hypothetical protein
MVDSNTSSATVSKRGSRINTMVGPSGSARSSFSKPGGGGGGGGLTTALLSDQAMNMFPLSPSNLEQMAFGLSQAQQAAYDHGASASAAAAIPLTLSYIIGHPDYFSFFVQYLSRDSQMELLWNFYISTVLYQDMDGDASSFEMKEMAQKIYQKFFDEDTLKGKSQFSQWILSMANVLQQEYCIAHGTAVTSADSTSSMFLLGEREEIQALDRVDDEIRRIAACVFSDDGDSVPRDLFDAFQHASLEIMEVWFFPKFIRSRYYRRLMRDIQQSNIIQARIERAHFL